jgi:hypothetical protein
VLASDGTVITVNVVLEIDKSVPTYGEVKPGDGGGGGNPQDARSSAPSVEPDVVPTSTPTRDRVQH